MGNDKDALMDYETQRGFTLVELLLALAVAAIVLSLAAPSMGALYRKHQVGNYQADLQRLIVHSRHHALVNRSRVTVCALDEQNTCVSLRVGTLASFVDSNGNRALDPGEQLLYSLPIPRQLRVDWNRGDPSLHFNGRGMSHVSNGTFTICHRAPLHSHGKLVISVQGRVRGERLGQACPLS